MLVSYSLPTTATLCRRARFRVGLCNCFIPRQLQKQQKRWNGTEVLRLLESPVLISAVLCSTHVKLQEVCMSAGIIHVQNRHLEIAGQIRGVLKASSVRTCILACCHESVSKLSTATSFRISPPSCLKPAGVPSCSSSLLLPPSCAVWSWTQSQCFAVLSGASLSPLSSHHMHKKSCFNCAEAPEAAVSLLYTCKSESASHTSVRRRSAPGSHPPITYTWLPSVTAWEAMRACMRA